SAEMSFFAGKVVIVTGSSNGIGRGTAKLLAAQGAKVTITGRNNDALKVTMQECLAAGAKEENILEIIADVGDESVPAMIVKKTVEKFGGLDVLVNNAGICLMDPHEGKLYIEAPIALFDQMMKVNLRAVVLFSQAAASHLEKTKGAIVNVSSIAGFPFAMQKDIYYAVTKAGLDQLTVQLAADLITRGIRVNSVNPGIIDTDIWAKLGLNNAEVQKALDGWGTDKQQIPIGRYGTPEDIGKLILFLSDRSQSEFIIGQRIVIDGGTLLQNTLLSTFASAM
ncbi:hypothetical protein PFISCL1PPCAC_23544, partial [Pristionchus fissidentatus]